MPRRLKRSRLDTVVKSEQPDNVLLHNAFNTEGNEQKHVVNKEKDKTKDEDEEKKQIINLKNPKVEKVEDMDLDLDSIRRRLKTIGFKNFPVHLEPDILEFSVSRDYLSHEYGGSMQAMFPTISKEKFAKHGLHFAYMNCIYQPYAPQWPGNPGLCFGASSDDESISLTYRLFTRIKSNTWQYMGNYKFKPSACLTTEEWSFRPEGEKHWQNVWATEICRQKWGDGVQARIYARKQNGNDYVPTADEINDIFKNGHHKTITPPEVYAAYMTGEEKMEVETAKCVGYDFELQNCLFEEFPKWVPPPKNSKKKKTHQKKMAKGGVKGKKARKRKIEEVESESEDEISDEDITQVDDSEDEEYHFMANRKGTRSRPRRD